MPIPKPIPDQSLDSYLKICIPFVINEGTAQSQEQARAICINNFQNFNSLTLTKEEMAKLIEDSLNNISNDL